VGHAPTALYFGASELDISAMFIGRLVRVLGLVTLPRKGGAVAVMGNEVTSHSARQ